MSRSIASDGDARGREAVSRASQEAACADGGRPGGGPDLTSRSFEKSPDLRAGRLEEGVRSSRRREPVRDAARRRFVSADERQTLYEIGRFRVVSALDLGELQYGGGRSRMRQDVRSLLSQGLIQRKTVWTGRHRQKETFFALTRAGKRLAMRNLDKPAGQAIYAGFVKSAELRHDAQIYPMYRREAERILQDGGRIRRVVLDYELKKKAYSPLAKAAALPAAEYAKRQREIARDHDLKIVNGHIVLPDLRIEYETPAGEARHLDLEVASGSYHGSHAAEKAAAGFRIYAAPDVARRLSAALEEREITADILSL